LGKNAENPFKTAAISKSQNLISFLRILASDNSGLRFCSIGQQRTALFSIGQQRTAFCMLSIKVVQAPNTHARVKTRVCSHGNSGRPALDAFQHLKKLNSG
jgi:hypothetical protein